MGLYVPFHDGDADLLWARGCPGSGPRLTQGRVERTRGRASAGA